MDFHIPSEEIQVNFEHDPDSGEWTAYNDDLRIMAVGPDQASALKKFIDALTFQIIKDLAQGLPLPTPVRSLVSTRSARSTRTPVPA